MSENYARRLVGEKRRGGGGGGGGGWGGGGVARKTWYRGKCMFLGGGVGDTGPV